MFNENRLKHIYGVACRCEELARESGACEEFCRQMFLLGWLHDIGYQYGNNQTHPDEGYTLLSHCGEAGTTGYKYSEEIRLHGYPEDSYKRNHDSRGYKLPKPYRSVALDILNKADITTSPTGEYVSPHARLLIVAAAYGGKESVQYQNMFKLCKELKLI